MGYSDKQQLCHSPILILNKAVLPQAQFLGADSLYLSCLYTGDIGTVWKRNLVNYLEVRCLLVKLESFSQKDLC